MSTNRQPMTSRYTRKENYQSLNFANTLQSVSPHRPFNISPSQDHSQIKKNIQQKQIQDLEKKVDLILEHNNTLVTENEVLKNRLREMELHEHPDLNLINENELLKKRLAEMQYLGQAQIQKERFSRYKMAEQGQLCIQRINGDLMYKKKQLQDVILSFQTYKEHSRKQIESLNQLISQLNLSSQTIKSQNSKLSQELFRLKEESQQEARMAEREYERKMQDQINKIKRENEDALAKQREFQEKLAAELAKKFQEEKNDWQNRKNILINKLQDTHNQQINELRDQLMNEFNKEKQKLAQEAEDKCRLERQKADKFIKDFIENMGPTNDSETDILKHEIKMLQQSLASRKKLIDELTNDDVNRQDLRSNINEAVIMRERLKDQIKHLMRENQLLKVKQGEKYERDLKEMVKIYDDKIDILSTEVKDLSNQNDRLRHNYEDEVTFRIKQRRQFQIEVSQLKNLIRKLKVELQGVQDQFKMNIDGMSMQSQTFSMTMMKSVSQIKQKSNFHEEENRKLRIMYEKHEKEVEKQKKQAQQKIKYYGQKVDYLNKLLESERGDLKQKENILMKKLDERQRNLRESVRQQREHMQQLISMAEEEKRSLQKDYIDCKQKLSEKEIQLKDAKIEIERLNTKIKQNHEHIERLRMELEMAGVNDKQSNDTLSNWKEHYEGIIHKLEEDKKELKVIIDGQNQRVEQLIYKYKLLEEELKKAAVALSKRGELNKKIIHLGMDENLVKNMSEIWARKSPRRQQS